MNPSTLAALTAFPQQLEDFYQAVPEGYQRWVPSSWEGIPSEAYNAIGQICHVRDIEIDGYHLRFERTLREDKPVLASLDGDALAAARNYQGANANDVLATFAAARLKTLQILSSLSEADLARQAVFEGYGPVTLRSLVHYLCSHDQQHLAGLQWLLGKTDAARAQEEVR